MHTRFAAQWAGYRWQEFNKLDGSEQDEIVATYEARQKIDAVSAYESHKKMKRPRGKRK